MYTSTPTSEYIITPMSNGTLRVWNELKDTNYLVYRAPRRWKCSCPDWEFRCKKWNVDCKHVKLVKTYIKKEDKL